MFTELVYTVVLVVLGLYILSAQEKEALKQKGITFYGVPLQEDPAYDDVYCDVDDDEPAPSEASDYDDYYFDSFDRGYLAAEELGIDIPSSNGVEDEVWSQEEMMPDYLDPNDAVWTYKPEEEVVERDPDSAYARAMRMTIRQLKAIASSLCIKNYGDMQKAVLAAAIVEAGHQFV